MSRDLRPLTAIPHPIVCVILRVGVSLPTDVLLRQAQLCKLAKEVDTMIKILVFLAIGLVLFSVACGGGSEGQAEAMG